MSAKEGTEMADSINVLVVEDEKDLADLYSSWLSDEYEVRTAYDAEEALEKMDDEVNAVLLDRRLPGMSGDEFLERIRADGHDCPVSMVSAVEPDFDIFDMGFNDYVVKPASKDELHDTVERMLTIEEAGPETQEYFSLLSKKEAIEAEKTDSELADSEEYAEILESLERFRNRVISLAERVVGSPTDNGPDGSSVHREALERWEGRLNRLDEDDPLYDAAKENVEKYRDRVEERKTVGNEAEREFLEAVADSFVAEGFWRDSRVLSALNNIFYNKFDDTFVIERQPLTEDAELDGEKEYEVSKAVRDRAEKELKERSNGRR